MTEKEYCDVCRLGVITQGKMAYTTWVDGMLVIVPDVPVWTCDVCGDYEYDALVLARLEALLGPEHIVYGSDDDSDVQGDIIHFERQRAGGRRSI